MNVKNILTKNFLFFSIVLTSMTTNAQNLKPVAQEKIKYLISTEDFVFIAETVSPIKGNTRSLTPGYEMQVLGDSIIAHLPYIGADRSGPFSPSNIGIDFRTSDFTYKTVEKKSGWSIAIIPKDVKNANQISLNVSRKGYATLQVLSNYRESISFTGYITER